MLQVRSEGFLLGHMGDHDWHFAFKTYCDCVTRLRSGLSKGRVYGDTCTEHWGRSVRGERFRDGCHVAMRERGDDN